MVRFYDINSCQCYVCPYPREHHTGPLTSVRYSADARVCASASKDGDIKVWDGVSGRCVQTFSKCHDGAEVCSVLFSRNGKVRDVMRSDFSFLVCYGFFFFKLLISFVACQYINVMLLYNTYCLTLAVHPFLWAGQHSQVVGAVHGSLPHRIHWCRLSG